MANKTIGVLSRETGVPMWLVRRTVDGLGVSIPRFGPYRAITPEIERKVIDELRRRGKLPEGDRNAG